MTLSDDFYGYLSDIFHQMTLNPGILPTIPLNQWPAESAERQILLDIQAAFSTLRTDNQQKLIGAEKKDLLSQSYIESSHNGVVISDLETGLVMEASPTACSMLGYTIDEVIGFPTHFFIHPEGMPSYEKCLDVVRNGGVFNGTIIYLHRDAKKRLVDQSATEIPYQKRACLLAFIRDVSELDEHSQFEQLVQQQVKVRTKELTILLEILQSLNSTLDIDPELILDQLHRIVAYSQASLFTVNESYLVAMAVRGPHRLEQSIPLKVRLDGEEILKILFNGHQSMLINDIRNSEPAAMFLRSLMKNESAVLLKGVRSWMWVPLAVKDRILGGLGIAHSQPNYFTQHHADMVLTAANQAAVTMANAELYEHAQMFASLQERQRLARNLHDAVNQSLFSASLIAEVLPRLWEQNPEEGQRSLEDLRRLTNGAMAEMRMMMAELRPMALTDVDINDMLCLLADAFTGRTNLPVSIKVLGEFAFPSEVQAVIYRLCQEGLNNIGRHAQATRAEIIVQYLSGWVNLLICDNGIGFDPSQIPPGHYGLSMMKERAESIGATLTVTSEVGQGTKIDIRWTENPEWKHV